MRDLGYDVITDKKELVLTGMTCAACSTRIEKGLNKMDGVLQANVNLALEKASVEFNPSAISTKDLIHKVESLGYGAMVKSDENEKEALITVKKRLKNSKESLFSQLFYRFLYFGQWLDILALLLSFRYLMHL